MAARKVTTERKAIDPFAEEIGKRIEVSRLAAGFKRQEDLAAALEPPVSVSTVYRWEAGERVPRLQHQLALCRALKQSHSFLFSFALVPAA